ncbi:ABC-2 type transport system ATP-binding protein [Actinopolyspora lacussalsi subsp. righensis]|uniref:ABC-2 type transport system ATP-binding protein n=1 Tax=Actinopolyspora righensis TaxID=995060 RepID=A0A1I6X8Q7_9ACTN|nr:ABC transporter ATP-binding protein [Actinopolyspora righensis]SFT34391.1 ABC-2 type transport system ATP-binding protein [Actinopolyspora righensis]
MTVAGMSGASKRYGDTVALDDVSLGFTENRIHGLLGRNGAGKTTIMQILTGQNFETSGNVEVFGEHPYENDRVLRDVCFIKESQKYPDMFAVHHALTAASLVYDNWDAELAEELVEEFALPLKRRIRKLSRGQMSTVGIIIGLASRAPLTFFDEPYLGLDAVARHRFYDRLLADYAEHPRTIVLSTHLIDEISDLIEHVTLMDKGRVLLDEDTDKLRASAVTVTGPARAVEEFAANHTELHREQLGGFLRVTLSGALPERIPEDLHVEPVSLQQLVVQTTRQATGEQTFVGAANDKETRS